MVVCSFLRPIKAFLHNNFERWLAKRIPSKKSHQLNSKNIMIYPTRFGLSYITLVILLFLLGTNYQNNIILLLSYLMASFFISVMLHSFYNFSQLAFYSNSEQSGFAGDNIYFPVVLTTQKAHYDLNLHFKQAELCHTVEKLVYCPQGSQTISLPYKSAVRGKFPLGRVVVFSEYSFGLFKSKTVLDFGHSAIVYPKPIRLLANQYQLCADPDESNTESYQANNTTGTDDFFELKNFIQGESRARTAWKQLAKGQGHFSKHYQASQGAPKWLSLESMPGVNLEQKLSYLSFLVREFSASEQSFGLLLSTAKLSPENRQNAMNIPPNSGPEHQRACLTALALY